MKRLYIVGGTMGVGKTTTCQVLKKKLDRAVFLDGDWCWDADPFQVTDETKAMVMDNICHVINNFLACAAYENVIFCWVIHEQAILDEILSRLSLEDVDVVAVSLIVGAEALTERLTRDVQNGVRQEDVIKRSVARLPMYEFLDTVKIDVSDISPEQAANRIAAL